MAKHTFRPGDVVFHPDYGKGTVEEGYDGELYVDANDPDVDYGPEEDPPDPSGVELTPEWKLVRKAKPEPKDKPMAKTYKKLDLATFRAEFRAEQAKRAQRDADTFAQPAPPLSAYKIGDIVWARSENDDMGPQVYVAEVIGITDGKLEVFEAAYADGGPEFSDMEYPETLSVRSVRPTGRHHKPGADAYSAVAHWRPKSKAAPGSRGKSHVEKMHEDIAAFKAKRSAGTSATGKIKHANGRYEIAGTDKWFSTQAKAEAYLAKKAR